MSKLALAQQKLESVVLSPSAPDYQKRQALAMLRASGGSDTKPNPFKKGMTLDAIINQCAIEADDPDNTPEDRRKFKSLVKSMTNYNGLHPQQKAMLAQLAERSKTGPLKAYTYRDDMGYVRSGVRYT